MAAMERGLAAVSAPPELTVVVAADLVAVVNRLERRQVTYTVDRGPLGEVAAKTVHQAGATTIVVGPQALDRPPAEVERILAHEGGHAVLHAVGEAVTKVAVDSSTTGSEMLRFIASVASEEYRIERRLCELGYPVAEQGTDAALIDHMSAVPSGVLQACSDPRSSADTLYYAHSVLGTIQPLTISLAYRLGAVTAGCESIHPDSWSAFAKNMWAELVARNWADRVELYARVPPVGEAWGGSVAATHLRQATEIERRLVRDIGFTVTGEARAGSRWSFRRVVDDPTLRNWLDRVRAEGRRLQLDGGGAS